jgi:hypothetical protein
MSDVVLGRYISMHKKRSLPLESLLSRGRGRREREREGEREREK